MKTLIFNTIGFFSALSLIMVLVYFGPDLIQGDLTSMKDFLEKYRGIEPFVIFIVPVVIIVGSAWIWKMAVHLTRKNPSS